jgi:hypothetical protein
MPMPKRFSFLLRPVLARLGVGLMSSCFGCMLLAQSQPNTPAAAPTLDNAKVQPAVQTGKPAVSAPYRNQPDRLAKRATAYYRAVWGIEAPNVKAVESGVILRFSFRVVDPVKARPLNDKKINPVLISPEKGVQLVIPTLEKVGQLRQTSLPEEGKSYWMAFSNSGRRLKPGDRVDVVIGNFRAQGLLVE